MPPKVQQGAPPKARVGVRLKEAIGGAKSNNRSADLDGLVTKYNSLKQKLGSLQAAVKSHHGAMVQLHRARLQVILPYHADAKSAFDE